MTGRALLLLAVALPVHAQHWRVLDASRQLRDTGAVAVRVAYTAGKLDLRPSAASQLYEVSVRYDGDRVDPLAQYDTASRRVELGVRSRRMSYEGDDHGEGTLRAGLSAKVPIALALELGAVQGDLQLGGLRLSDLSLKGGAAELTLRFDEKSAQPLGEMTLDVGAAAVKVLHAGNSGVQRVRANVGAGALDLDLGGESARDVELSALVALGSLTVHVPPDVGVFVDATTFLGSFEKEGLVKRDDGWFTPNFDSAARHLRVRVRAILGGFTLARDAR